MKYKKKPVVIDAVQFLGCSTSSHQVDRWMKTGVDPEPNTIHTRDIIHMDIETLEGTMKASPHDWIIKGVNGEFYPCKPDIFEKTYTKVEG